MTPEPLQFSPVPTVTMAPKRASNPAKVKPMKDAAKPTKVAAKPTKEEVELVAQIAKSTTALSKCRAEPCKTEVEVVRNASNALLKLVLTLAAQKPKDWKEQAAKAQRALMHGEELAALTACSRKHCFTEMNNIMKLFKHAMRNLCKTDPKQCEAMKKVMPPGLGA